VIYFFLHPQPKNALTPIDAVLAQTVLPQIHYNEKKDTAASTRIVYKTEYNSNQLQGLV
jgi:hypothetical protein